MDEKRSKRNTKYDVQRGEIIRVLVPWFGKQWLRAKTIQFALAELNSALSIDDLNVHFDYLEQAGLIEVRRNDPRTALRDSEKPCQADLVRLTNRGLQMYDGKIECDPGIAF